MGVKSAQIHPANAEKELLMKRIVSLALVLVMALTCLVAFSSCNNMEKKIAGTYEMKSVTGTMTMNGQTIELSEDLYEYYRIVLNDDGTAEVQCKYPNSTSKVEEEGTWEWDKDDEVIKLKTKPEGSPVSVTEEMEWEDDVITYTASMDGDGYSISFTLVLEKVED